MTATEIKVIEVDDDCIITYSDGAVKTCPFRPHMTFQDCEPGYGSGGHCAKYNFYHSNTTNGGNEGDEG